MTRDRTDLFGDDDFADIARTDRMIDDLVAGHPVRGSDPAEDQLLGMLGSWRASIDSVPAAESPVLDAIIGGAGTETPADAVVTPLGGRRGRNRGLTFLGSAAAGLAILAGGVAIGAAGSGGTDVRDPAVVDGTEAVSLATSIEDKLKQAESSIDAGRVGEAGRLLGEAGKEIERIGVEDTREELEARIADLDRQIAALAARTVTETVTVGGGPDGGNQQPGEGASPLPGDFPGSDDLRTILPDILKPQPQPQPQPETTAAKPSPTPTATTTTTPTPATSTSATPPK